jgi:glutaredoxin 3
MQKVLMYTTHSCFYCKLAKQYFAQNGIHYEEKYVDEDQAALTEMMKKSGQMGVPVIDVSGKIVIGFDKDELKKILSIQE